MLERLQALRLEVLDAVQDLFGGLVAGSRRVHTLPPLPKGLGGLLRRRGLREEALGPFLGGWRRFWLITLPALAPELGFAAGLSAALSIGDMTVIALFGSQQFQTLPWLLYQTMGRYRAEDAAALALLLLFLTLLLFVGFVKGAALLRGRQIDVTD